MVSIRAAKSKGSQFEYDCQHSLSKLDIYKNISRTAERGFQMQYDLHADFYGNSFVFECKRLKGVSWNQMQKIYEKLEKVTPNAVERYLLFQSNRQPCLVFHREYKNGCLTIQKFEDVFGNFEKHPSTRTPRKKPCDS